MIPQWRYTQVTLIRSLLDEEGARRPWGAQMIPCATVDSFQGRERGIIIFSAVNHGCVLGSAQRRKQTSREQSSLSPFVYFFNFVYICVSYFVSPLPSLIPPSSSS